MNQLVLAATTTTLTSTPNPSVYGQSILFSATITSSIGSPPDGDTVTFKQSATVLGTGILGGGTATLSTSTLGPGNKAIAVVYAGDASFSSSVSKAVTQVISKAGSTTTVTSSLNPSIFGQSVTLTATVAPQFNGTPTGTMTFRDGAVRLGVVTLNGGVATYTSATLAVGTHRIVAVYSGSTLFTASTSPLLNQVVRHASTAMPTSGETGP